MCHAPLVLLRQNPAHRHTIYFISIFTIQAPALARKVCQATPSSSAQCCVRSLRSCCGAQVVSKHARDSPKLLQFYTQNCYTKLPYAQLDAKCKVLKEVSIENEPFGATMRACIRIDNEANKQPNTSDVETRQR